MNQIMFRGIAALWTGSVAVIKTYQANGDIVAVIESIDWMAVSAFVAFAWAFLKRQGDKSPKQVAAAVTKAADAAYEAGRADATRESSRPVQ